jgi:hypothetical protein
MVTCRTCEADKPLEEFTASRRMCKPCWAAYMRAWNKANMPAERVRAKSAQWRQAHPEENRLYMQAYNLLRKYGLTVEQYDAMLEAQGGGCGICGAPQGEGRGGRFHVDHDHVCCPPENGNSVTCGECVRGLLCSKCNKAIGLMRENVDHLRSAIAYLETHAGRRT